VTVTVSLALAVATAFTEPQAELRPRTRSVDRLTSAVCPA
jgi:hypothetical protein